MTLLTGLDAGHPDARGHWPPGSLNRRIAERLARFVQRRHAAETAPIRLGHARRAGRPQGNGPAHR